MQVALRRCSPLSVLAATVVMGSPVATFNPSFAPRAQFYLPYHVQDSKATFSRCVVYYATRTASSRFDKSKVLAEISAFLILMSIQCTPLV